MLSGALSFTAIGIEEVSKVLRLLTTFSVVLGLLTCGRREIKLFGAICCGLSSKIGLSACDWWCFPFPEFGFGFSNIFQVLKVFEFTAISCLGCQWPMGSHLCLSWIVLTCLTTRWKLCSTPGLIHFTRNTTSVRKTN